MEHKEYSIERGDTVDFLVFPPNEKKEIMKLVIEESVEFFSGREAYIVAKVKLGDKGTYYLKKFYSGVYIEITDKTELAEARRVYSRYQKKKQKANISA